MGRELVEGGEGEGGKGEGGRGWRRKRLRGSVTITMTHTHVVSLIVSE